MSLYTTVLRTTFVLLAIDPCTVQSDLSAITCLTDLSDLPNAINVTSRQHLVTCSIAQKLMAIAQVEELQMALKWLTKCQQHT